MDNSLICIICNDVNGLKRMGDIILKQEGNILTFREALISCFNLQFFEKSSNNHNMICEKCAEKLTYCCAFRKDVEVAHKRLYSALETDGKANISKISETPIKIEYEPRDFINGHVIESKYFLEDFDLFGEGIETADDGRNHCNNYDEEQNFNDNSSDSDWSVKTNEILRATGYWKELETIKSKPRFFAPILVDKKSRACPECSETFNLHSNLVKHFKQHFASHLCEVCGKTYASLTCLNNHKIIHKGVTHKCSECDKSFPSIRHLKSHTISTHRKAKRFVCYVCNERFADSHKRRNHLVMEHKLENEKNQCPLCEYTWLTNGNFRNHLKKFHFDAWHIKCVECSLVFLKLHEEQKHLVTHSGARDHKCKFCSKEFIRIQTLKEHIKLHLDIKSYICNECDKAFAQRAALLGHMKTHNKQRSKIYTAK